MNMKEFLDIVRRERIRPDAFSLYETENESLVLDKDGYRWIVFYSERGLQSGKKIFRSESEALEYMLSLLKNYPKLEIKE